MIVVMNDVLKIFFCNSWNDIVVLTFDVLVLFSFKQGGYTALIRTSCRGDKEGVERLLFAGADINHQNIVRDIYYCYDE